MLLIVATVALFFLLWLLFIPAGPILQHSLAAVSKKATSFRYNDYVPVILLLVAGAIGTGIAADQFLDLAEEVRGRSETLRRVDGAVHEWARSQRSAGATWFFTAFTMLGSPAGLATIVVAVVAALSRQRRYRWAVYLLFTTGVGALMVIELKILFARARPDLAAAILSVDGYSFPSGHAMGTTFVFGALSYLVLRMRAPWRQRAAGLAAAATIIIAVSVSRVYLGVHWISDIGAGISAGALWVLVTTVAYETFRRIRIIRSLRSKRSAAQNA